MPFGRGRRAKKDSFKKPKDKGKTASRDSRQAPESFSSDAMSSWTLQNQTRDAMRATPSCSSLESESSQFSHDGRSSRKRPRGVFEENSNLSMDLESSRGSSVFCSYCKERDSEIAGLMKELSIADQLRKELEEKRAKFLEEEQSKEEALARLTQEQSTCNALTQELEIMRAKYEEENRLKDDALNRLMKELSITDQLKKEFEEKKAKLLKEEQSKEEALARLTQEQSTCHTLKQELEIMHAKYEEENRLKDDALNRLSALASSRLRENNANIADLSDQYRPTKIAEQFSELYDNEWTDAFDGLQNKDMDERDTIQFLLNSLMETFRICKEISTDNYFEKIQHSIEFPVQKECPSYTQCVLPDDLKQQIKEFRKSRAPHVIEDVVKEVLNRVKSEHSDIEQVLAYKRRCAEICWLMVVQNPPLVLSETADPKFNNNEYKDYTKRGKFVEYLVWPALFLQEGGALLSKGVAQGCKKIP